MLDRPDAETLFMPQSRLLIESVYAGGAAVAGPGRFQQDREELENG